ncbi:MAG: cupin domain-containing protein [Pseudomonadota bacterium]
MPKIETCQSLDRMDGPHPITGQDDGPFYEVVLGRADGLSQFGVRLERLPPGSRSSHRHWHESEDEFVFIVSGQVVLIEDEETVLQAGDSAGWKTGTPVARCLENRVDHDAVMLIAGTRSEQDVVHYPDHDLIFRKSRDGKQFTRGDGSSVERQS